MTGATVEFRHVTKVYGARQAQSAAGAVNDLSLVVPPGEICVLVGPSGCGKTTSLKMVNRLVEPTSGQVLIDDQDVSRIEVTALRRRIGYVIQPIGAVDPIVRERLQNEFLRLHRTLGMTVLFVTHDIDEAIKMGNRVAIMQQGGHLAQYAPPAELLIRPANDFVARFVGVDRGLKRLSLLHVADVPLAAAPVARAGEVAPHGAQHVLLLDAETRPLGWVDVARADSRQL